MGYIEVLGGLNCHHCSRDTISWVSPRLTDLAVKGFLLPLSMLYILLACKFAPKMGWRRLNVLISGLVGPRPVRI